MKDANAEFQLVTLFDATESFCECACVCSRVLEAWVASCRAVLDADWK